MGRRKPATTHGLLVIDKPAGVTSHDVVAMIRRRFGERQVGHAGTLDPDATGVLVVAVGMATRLLRFVGDTTKVYAGEVVFGVETDSLDSTGSVTVVHEMSPPDVQQVRSVIADRFMGTIEQIPPMVSAIRVGGRRLHELAREGTEVERVPRPVTIYRFEIADPITDPMADPMVISIEVACSSGTYIRSLAADLGTALGGGAHLRGLRRLAVGAFTIDEAAPPDTAELLGVDQAVRHLAQVTVDAETTERIAHGQLLAAFDGAGPWAVFDADGVLLAVYERQEADRAKPVVVLPTATGR